MEKKQREGKSEDTREQLIRQGVKLLREHGYHGTGIQKIVNAVNVPKGSFYNFFSSKEAFAAEVINKYTSATIAKIDALLENKSDGPLTSIKKTHHYMIDILEKDELQGCLAGNMCAEIVNSSKECRKALKGSLDKWRLCYIRLIRDGQKNNIIRDDLSAEILADILWSVWQGGILQMRISGNAMLLREKIDVTLDVLFAPNY